MGFNGNITALSYILLLGGSNYMYGIICMPAADNNMLQATIFPNPATKEATISVDCVMGKVEIIVSDINGRTFIQDETVCTGQLSKSINIEQWAKGTYFVRIINNETVAIQKLIVR